MNLIIGPGAVGGVIAGFLAQAGQPVALLVRPESRERYAGERLVVDGPGGGRLIDCPAPAVVTEASAGTRRVFVAVKHPALDDVLEGLARSLPEEVPVAACLNGIGVRERVRERLPGHPAELVTVMFNAAVLEPLHYRLTTDPALLVHSDDARLQTMLTDAGFRVAPGGEAVARGKLLLNLNNALAALTGRPVRDIMVDPALRRAFVASLDEATAVLDAAGLAWHLPSPLPYRFYRLLVRYAGGIAWRLAQRTNGITSDSYPSMVADVAAGRATEVDELNGAVRALGRQVGMGTPVHDTLVELVRELESGRRTRLEPRQLLAHLRAARV